MNAANDDFLPRLRASAAELNAIAAETILADPFWVDRYGEEGSRTFAFEDGRLHLKYVAEALAKHDPGIMTGYATRLRALLVPRGMCSEHLADAFRVLAGAIAAHHGTPGAAAVDMFGHAEAALLHAAPAARALQEQIGALAAAVADDVRARLPHAPARADVVFDARHLVSYLADALAWGAPDTLAVHVRWTAGYMHRRGRPAAYLGTLLESIAQECVPGIFGADARAYLASLVQELQP
jgi:hypothetical protein